VATSPVIAWPWQTSCYTTGWI